MKLPVGESWSSLVTVIAHPQPERGGTGLAVRSPGVAAGIDDGAARRARPATHSAGQSPTGAIRVVLVDDHPAMLRQVSQLLPAEFRIVAALGDGTRLEAAVGQTHPDVIVLDITLPGTSGIELARRLTGEGCTAGIVFLTVHADVDFAREALDAGALGYVVKLRLASDLVPALRAALDGRRFISPCPELESLR